MKSVRPYADSLEPEFKTIWSTTYYLHIGFDSIISDHETASSASTELWQIQSSSAETHFLSLNVQGAAGSVVLTNILNITGFSITRWQ